MLIVFQFNNCTRNEICVLDKSVVCMEDTCPPPPTKCER